MKALEQYLQMQFGLDEQLSPMPAGDIQKLPILFRSHFRFYSGHLGPHPVIWAEVLNAADAKPTQLQKQFTHLMQHFQQRVILVLGTLDSWSRRRLIALQVPFVHPPTHLFVPEFLLELNDSPRSVAAVYEPKAHLSAPAQAALIQQVLHGRLQQLSLQEIAQSLNYSAMTMTRIAREFGHLQLAQIEGGREKHLIFNAQGRQLWEKAMPYLRTPVKEIWHCDTPLSGPDFWIAGESALAIMTMLSEPDEPCYAIGKERFIDLRSQGYLPLLDARRGDFCIQVWHYDPGLQTSGSVVDPLSLWLSLSGSDNERIEQATDELLRTVTWSQD